jgi:hypothetical protein
MRWLLLETTLTFSQLSTLCPCHKERNYYVTVHKTPKVANMFLDEVLLTARNEMMMRHSIPFSNKKKYPFFKNLCSIKGNEKIDDRLLILQKQTPWRCVHPMCILKDSESFFFRHLIKPVRPCLGPL